MCKYKTLQFFLLMTTMTIGYACNNTTSEHFTDTGIDPKPNSQFLSSTTNKPYAWINLIDFGFNKAFTILVAGIPL
jgi:hypothetical protein